MTLFGREFKAIVALEGPKKALRRLRAFFGPSQAFEGHPKREGVALMGTAWLWKVPEGFPTGIHGAETPEIDTVWDYKANGALFEGALVWLAAF